MESSTLIKIELGKKVSYQGANYRVAELIDLSLVIIVNEVTGEFFRVYTQDL